MTSRTIVRAVAAGILLQATAALAQVDLAQPPGRRIVDGVVAGAHAGLQLDRGDLNGDINNKELVVAAPNWSSDTGRVYVIFGWVKKAGDFDLNSADVTLTGAAAGDLFGRGTAVGFVRTVEQPLITLQTTPRDLVIGAPGAFGGKGAVYLFDSPIASGTTLSTANASLTIIGRPGDQLGRGLGTADLNHDGYREIVAGAPGNNRAYVVDAHTAHGTIDLSTSTPLSTLTAPGIGTVFYGGDVTGDGIQDIALGAPTANSSAGAVYVLKGRGSSAEWPAAVDLPTAADGVFVGANANDQAGASLWIARVDSDTVLDLVIGAPGVSALGRTS